MFTIDTVVDTAVKTAKQGLSYVPNESFKKEFEGLVDAQAAYVKTSYYSGLEIAKTFAETFGKYDAQMFDLSKYFKAVK